MIKITYYNDEGNEVEHELPSKKDVCPECNGDGFVLAGGMRGEAYTAEEFQECFDEEEADEYFKVGGRYDQQCDMCHGNNVIDVVDECNLSKEEEKVWAEYQSYKAEQACADYADEQERRGERMMGC